LSVASCSSSEDSRLFVPGPGYTCEVKILLPSEAKVGEWINLKASRTSGPWVQVAKSDVAKGVRAVPKAPPPVEENVQANLSWDIDPPGRAEFNMPTIDSVRTDPLARKVKFNEPGVYKISGTTSFPTKATSKVETITIH
jgi:hypothetical protein